MDKTASSISASASSQLERPASDAPRRADHAERLRRVTDYIHSHLDGALDLNRLADIACVSPHHWHRIYHAVHGETMAATVRRLRLHRAAGDLANTSLPVAKVARRWGYEDVSSFTRIFKAAYQLTPARFRLEGKHSDFESAERASAASHPVRVEQLAPLSAIGLDHRGSYAGIGHAFERLIGRHVSRGDVTLPVSMLGLFHDDPETVAPAALRSTACLIVASDHALADVDVRGGWHAVLTYRGPYASMREAYRWFYGTWLMQSGFEPADAPVAEAYLNDPRTTAADELLTEIRLPLVTG